MKYKGTIHYLAHYADDGNKDEYQFAVPAKAKMDYLIKAICEAGYHIQILSLANSRNKTFIPAKKKKINESLSIKYVAAVCRKNKILAIISTVLRYVQQVFYICFSIKKGETLLVYHSNAFIPALKLARKLKKFRLVEDIEELYAHSWGLGEREREREVSFLESADAYLLVNDTIRKTIKTMNKPFAVVYGSYIIPNMHDVSFNDDKIHVVYAGTIESVKLGAHTAARSARYFDKRYHLHILGSGRTDAINELFKIIDEINFEKGFTIVSYDGFLSGQDFTDFLCKCRIGISSYIMNEDFSNNVFPSKLMTYICHNLTVVTGYSESFVKAKISMKWVYYNQYNPEQIAAAVMSIPRNTSVENNKDLVLRLHKEFVGNLSRIL